MNYFDPSRPRICGRPAYVAEGKAIAPLPLFCIEPTENGYTISFMLLHDDGGGVWYEQDCNFISELVNILSRWEAEPEAVLADLGWTYRLPRVPEPTWSEAEDEELNALWGAKTLSLDDIE